MGSGNVQNEISQTLGDELGLKDIIGFLKRNGRRVLLCGLAALVLAGVYAAISPNKFEARWQLRLAHFVASSNSGNINGGSGSSDSRNVLIEDPAALIQRLRLPTAYSAEVQGACGMTGEFDEYLDHALEISAVKNVAGLVEMKVRAASTSQAMRCAEALVTMISVQQHDMIEEQMSGYRAQVLKYRQTLAQLRQRSSRKSDVFGPDAVSNYESAAQLRIRIDDLEGEIFQSQSHPAQLAAPIYVQSKPISPKVTPLLALAGVLGLVLGVLYELGRESWREHG